MQGSVTFNNTYVKAVSAQLIDWIGENATREQAAAALDVWRYRGGIDAEIRAAVLGQFRDCRCA